MNTIKVTESPEGIKVTARGKNKNNVSIGNEISLSIEDMRDYRSVAKALHCLSKAMMSQYDAEKDK